MAEINIFLDFFVGQVHGRMILREMLVRHFDAQLILLQ